MRVRQDNCIELVNRNRQPAIFFRSLLPSPLKHPAVESYGTTIYVKQVARARDFPRGAGEGYLQILNLPLLRRVERG